MASPRELLQSGDGLLLIDVQVDFCPGGALPISDGDKVVPVLNGWIAAARQQGIPIYASRDWPPLCRPSFSSEGGTWPEHCIQDTGGARFHPDLKLPEDVVLIAKGVRFDGDQYSVFDQTGLTVQLRRDGVRRLWVGGLALDVCVHASVLDALQEGHAVKLLLAATRAVSPTDGREAVNEMEQAGAQIVEDKL